MSERDVRALTSALRTSRLLYGTQVDEEEIARFILRSALREASQRRRACAAEALADAVFEALEAQHDTASHVHAAECCWPFPGASSALRSVLAEAPQDQMEARLATCEALLRRAHDRIRHDHAYPMEVGPHHCDGCDLRDEIAEFIWGARGRSS